ncbi:MAG: galactose ABC transporter substrate-binding protein [Oscillospiraceae bacterium]|nr:galactose ABC transporter substrate-binding protein [Oscillospiraceae bacterium]
MKKLLSYLCLLALLLAPLAGCARRERKVGILIYDKDDTFVSEMLAKMTAQIPDDCTYVIRDGANSQAVQNQQIIELIKDGVSILLINAVDRSACGAIVEKCAAEDVPVIFFNREPLEDSMRGENTYYVGPAADRQGALQAEMVAGLFGGDFAGGRWDRNGDGVVQLVVLKGEQGHQDAEKRTTNCLSRLTQLGYQTQVLAISVANWTRSEGYAAMETLYAEYGGDIELVFSNNDDMALGAIDYLTQKGVFAAHPDDENYDQPFVIVGVDGTAVGLEAVWQGLLYGTVLNDSTAQADAVLRLMECMLGDGDLSDYPYDITSGNYIFVENGVIILRSDMSKFDK